MKIFQCNICYDLCFPLPLLSREFRWQEEVWEVSNFHYFTKTLFNWFFSARGLKIYLQINRHRHTQVQIIGESKVQVIYWKSHLKEKITILNPPTPTPPPQVNILQLGTFGGHRSRSKSSLRDICKYKGQIELNAFSLWAMICKLLKNEWQRQSHSYQNQIAIVHLVIAKFCP